MIKLTQRIESGDASASVTLALHDRVRARLRVTLDDGRDAGVFLNRGPIMRGGDLLLSDDGELVKIVAAVELLSVVLTDNPHLLARACYHLGNRHVPLQIMPGEVRYQHDHVLDNMIRGLGLEPRKDTMPFEPEAGAYSEHGSDHSHDH
ncbi:MAG: urease accessory protein UreE [Pseudomonadota bacterium]